MLFRSAAGQPLLRAAVARAGATVHTRVLARLLEIARVLPLMEAWLAGLRPREPFAHPHALPDEGQGEGTTEASMVKAYVCKAAEWVTREAMQIHGGYGYAEEYPVSRMYVDARVLSIFEGADETLCLKVIARRLVESVQG